MMESVEKTIKKVKARTEDTSNIITDSSLLKLVENYETKRTHYGMLPFYFLMVKKFWLTVVPSRLRNRASALDRQQGHAGSLDGERGDYSPSHGPSIVLEDHRAGDGRSGQQVGLD